MAGGVVLLVLLLLLLPLLLLRLTQTATRARDLRRLRTAAADWWSPGVAAAAVFKNSSIRKNAINRGTTLLFYLMPDFTLKKYSPITTLYRR